MDMPHHLSHGSVHFTGPASITLLVSNLLLISIVSLHLDTSLFAEFQRAITWLHKLKCDSRVSPVSLTINWYFRFTEG